MINRAVRQLQDELARAGVPFEISEGTRHHKVFVDGRLVGIVSRRPSESANNRGAKNVRSQVRRAIRECVSRKKS